MSRRDKIQLKKEMALTARVKGFTANEIASALDMHLSTIYEWFSIADAAASETREQFRKFEEDARKLA